MTESVSVSQTAAIVMFPALVSESLAMMLYVCVREETRQLTILSCSQSHQGDLVDPAHFT